MLEWAALRTRPAFEFEVTKQRLTAAVHTYNNNLNEL